MIVTHNLAIHQQGDLPTYDMYTRLADNVMADVDINLVIPKQKIV